MSFPVLPVGCSETVQISFIEDEALRPAPEYKWLYHTINKSGDTLSGCAMTFDDATLEARRRLHNI